MRKYLTENCDLKELNSNSITVLLKAYKYQFKITVFCNYQSVLLKLFTFSPSLPASISLGNHQSGFCIYESVSIFLFIYIVL